MSTTFQAVNDLFLVGKTLKSHGTAGQLRLMVEERFHVYFRAGAFVFLDLNGSKVPFQIAEVHEGQHFVVLFEGIRGKDDSDALTGKEIWIPVEQVKDRHLKSPHHLKAKWEDYKIRDEENGTVYVILRTEEYPQQLMAVIDVDGREVLIPLSDQLISEIDKEQQVIHMNIPDGLLDL